MKISSTAIYDSIRNRYSVVLSSEQVHSNIRYTLDGKGPTSNGKDLSNHLMLLSTLKMLKQFSQ
ncbi:MAG TPA: FN3 associated domain-containing protein [Fluviicola sp.]|nr:FN3 associated domain-containing protein [Fluviicola sp.]